MAKKVFNLIVGIFAGILADMKECRKNKENFWFRMLIWAFATILILVVFWPTALVQANWVLGIATGFFVIFFMLPNALFGKSDIISRWPHS